MDSLDTLLDQLVTSCRILGAEGQGDMVWGHASVRDPGGRGLWMKTADLGLEEVTRDDPLCTGTSDLILPPALGSRVAATLGDRPALLLVGHGLVAAGSDVVEATMAAILLDRACRMQLEVLKTGRPYRWTPDDES